MGIEISKLVLSNFNLVSISLYEKYSWSNPARYLIPLSLLTNSKFIIICPNVFLKMPLSFVCKYLKWLGKWKEVFLFANKYISSYEIFSKIVSFNIFLFIFRTESSL